ncbi:MAG: NAD-dependent epimerase/dehydratase family protein [Bacteroidales bacterium]|nr:NAD-dependent epimerase/dehydratase family protein [Bacteroidales bacterium]
MKVFVTGGTGFIGEKLIRHLLNKGFEVNALYRSEKKKNQLGLVQVNWIQGDITDESCLNRGMEGCDAVFHVAAYAVAWEEHPGDFRKYNVQGTVNVMNAALNNKIKKVVFTSTAGIFGPSFHGTINEKSVSPIPHFTGYERSKAEAEYVIINEYIKKKGLNVVIVNPTRVFGPGALNQSNSTTLMIKKYIEGKWHFLPGDGRAIGNYAFIDDVVEGHLQALEKGRTGENYILGGENISYQKFFDIVSQVSNKKYRLIPIPVTLMLGVAYCFVGLNKIYSRFLPPITPAHVSKFSYNWETSCNKAINELGYKITPFEQAVKKTVLYFKQI